jgi:phospholipid/cholesterol/gamma-HCH transport system permease protein
VTVTSEEAPSGPFAGRASRAVGWVPSGVRGVLGEAGGMTQLLGQVIWSAVRHPRGYWVATLDYTYVTLRRSALPVGLALTGFMVMFTVLALVFFSSLGAVALFPPILLRVNIEAFMVWAVSLVMAGIVGASLTTELGARGVREELDALRVLGIDPVRELVVPRVVATVGLTALIGIPSTALVVVVSQVAGKAYAQQNAAQYYNFVYGNMSPIELFLVVLNCMIAGVIIATVCAYKGLNAKGGSQGLGEAVNQAVVVAFLVVWSYQTVFTSIAQGVLDLGRFK